MISPDQIATAYEAMVDASTKFTDAIVKRDDAENALVDAEDAEMLDLDLSNPATASKSNAKMRKAAKKELAAYRKAKRHAVIAEGEYRKAGIKVDSLNKQIEADKLAHQK